MFRLWTANLSLIVLLFLALSPTAAYAQYLYLDSNGDGIHDRSDTLSTAGTTFADVWIVTDRTRSGNAVLCTTDPSASMTIFSLELTLRAVGGTVRWESFQNLVAEWSVLYGPRSDTSEVTVFFGGWTKGPPGTYRVASLLITPLSGAPSVVVTRESHLAPWSSGTSFGSECAGEEFDNTMKLGQEWFDVDGLPAPGSIDGSPRFQPVENVVLREAETADRTIVVTDGESDSVRLTAVHLPRFAAFEIVEQSPGRVSSTIHFAPGFQDAGPERVVLKAADDVQEVISSFYVLVEDVNHAPEFEPVVDLEIEFGTVTNQPILVRDVDGGTVTTRLQAAPNFATLQSSARVGMEYRSTLRLAPLTTDVGTWSILLQASDGIVTVDESFSVRVLETSRFRAPTLDTIPDFELRQMEHRRVPVVARDADGQTPTLTLTNAPSFVWIGPRLYGEEASPGLVDWDLSVGPPHWVVGEWTPTVTASDGVLSTSRTFRVAVIDSQFAPQISLRYWFCVAQGEVRAYRTFASDFDGDLLGVTSGPAPPWGTVIALSPTQREYTFAPTSDDPVEEYPIEIVAVDATGLVAREIQIISLTLPGECGSGGGFAGGDPGPAPVPDAGGPYSGVAGAPIRLDGAGTLNGMGFQYLWSFGDGTSALGRAVSHRYIEGGHYTATLTVRRGSDSTSYADTTLVTVRDALPARAFVAPEGSPIVLRAARPLTGVMLERVGSEYALEDILPSSLCLWSPGHGEVDSIFASEVKAVRVEDRDRNGVPEIEAAFAKDDLRRLLADVRGKRAIPARLQGRLPSGARVRAPLTLEVHGAPARVVAVWPNPMNPRGVIAFEARRPGHAVIRLFDVNGRLVRTLLDGRVEMGDVQVPIDGLDEHGRDLSSGVYFYQVTTADGAWRGRVTILK